VAAVILAMATTYALSVPVPTFDDARGLEIPWTVVGVAWAALLAIDAEDGIALGLSILLVIGAALTAFVAFFLYIFDGPIAVVGWLALGYLLFGLVALRAKRRRRSWFVAPAVVLITGISAIRFGWSEPELSRFAESIEQQGSVIPTIDVPVSVGSLDVNAVDLADGCVHLTTGYVGLLDDYPVGLAHCPGGTPSIELGDYEPLDGSWYRWYAASEFPFD
jgi:hypothetical protein